MKVVATSAAGDLGSAGYSVANWQNWIQYQKHLKRPSVAQAMGVEMAERQRRLAA